MTMITPSYLGETIEYSSLHACRSTLEDPTAEARDTGDDVIAVHGVVYVIARDEKIAIEIGDGDVGDDEAVAIVVKHETAGDFVAGSLLLRGPLLRNGGLVVRGSGGLVVATENETRMREFIDEATFFQFCEHF